MITMTLTITEEPGGGMHTHFKSPPEPDATQAEVEAATYIKQGIDAAIQTVSCGTAIQLGGPA